MKVLLAITLGFVLCISIFAQTYPTEKAPGFALKDLKGKSVRLSDFKGKVVVINFWATWCPPCRAEMPQLIKWQTEYAGRGLQFIGITVPPTNNSKVIAFTRKVKVSYPVLYGSKKTKALFTAIETMPFTVVIDKKGNIQARIEGIIYQDEFDEKVSPLLKPDIVKQ